MSVHGRAGYERVYGGGRCQRRWQETSDGVRRLTTNEIEMSVGLEPYCGCCVGGSANVTTVSYSSFNPPSDDR